MELENLASEVKEQRTPQAQAGYAEITAFFQKFNSRDVDAAEAAWNYYLSLDSQKRAELRQYKPMERELCFNDYLRIVQGFKPSGMARLVGHIMLVNQINEELKSLPISEKITYLNGGELLIW